MWKGGLASRGIETTAHQKVKPHFIGLQCNFLMSVSDPTCVLILRLRCTSSCFPTYGMFPITVCYGLDLHLCLLVHGLVVALAHLVCHDP